MGNFDLFLLKEREMEEAAQILLLILKKEEYGFLVCFGLVFLAVSKTNRKNELKIPQTGESKGTTRNHPKVVLIGISGICVKQRAHSLLGCSLQRWTMNVFTVDCCGVEFPIVLYCIRLCIDSSSHGQRNASGVQQFSSLS